MNEIPHKPVSQVKLARFYAEEIERGLAHIPVLLERYRQVTDFGSYHYAVDSYERLRHAACHRSRDPYQRKRLLEEILTQLRMLALELEGFAEADGSEAEQAEAEPVHA